MNTRRQLEEVHFLLCSLLPSEHFAFLHDVEQWSSLLDDYIEHGSAPTDRQPPSTCRFQVCISRSPIWFEIELPMGYPNETGPVIHVKGNNLSRSNQQTWQAVIREKLDKLRAEGADFIVQTLLCLHLLPLLQEQATAAQSSQPIDSPAVSPTSTETYHVLFTSHHLISPTKRRNLHKWASELSVYGFAKIGYPGVIYAEGAQADVTELVSRVKAMQWLALKVRFEERLDTHTFAKLTFGESLDNKDGDKHWIELEKIGEVVEFMRRCGRENFVTSMGLGSA